MSLMTRIIGYGAYFDFKSNFQSVIKKSTNIINYLLYDKPRLNLFQKLESSVCNINPW